MSVQPWGRHSVPPRRPPLSFISFGRKTVVGNRPKSRGWKPKRSRLLRIGSNRRSSTDTMNRSLIQNLYACIGSLRRDPEVARIATGGSPSRGRAVPLPNPAAPRVLLCPHTPTPTQDGHLMQTVGRDPYSPSSGVAYSSRTDGGVPEAANGFSSSMAASNLEIGATLCRKIATVGASLSYGAVRPSQDVKSDSMESFGRSGVAQPAGNALHPRRQPTRSNEP